MITVNTVLSLLAADYPANRLAVYVSDDGCSPITFYSLIEALKFAKIWVPFCKKYEVEVRAPFRYFSGDLSFDGTEEFQCEWSRMKVTRIWRCGFDNSGITIEIYVFIVCVIRMSMRS